MKYTFVWRLFSSQFEYHLFLLRDASAAEEPFSKKIDLVGSVLNAYYWQYQKRVFDKQVLKNLWTTLFFNILTLRLGTL